jgi:hypothetical protein
MQLSLNPSEVEVANEKLTNYRYLSNSGRYDSSRR